jgi:hypothetical protein
MIISLVSEIEREREREREIIMVLWTVVKGPQE